MVSIALYIYSVAPRIDMQVIKINFLKKTSRAVILIYFFVDFLPFNKWYN